MSVTSEGSKQTPAAALPKPLGIATPRQRRELLDILIKLGRQLASPGLDAENSPGPYLGCPARNRTAEMALFALRTHGRLHISELLIEVRGMGWKGSGDDGKDKDRIYAALHRRPDAAISCGGGLWAAKVAQVSEATSSEAEQATEGGQATHNVSPAKVRRFDDVGAGCDRGLGAAS